MTKNIYLNKLKIITNMKKICAHLVFCGIILISFSCWNVDIVKPPVMPDITLLTNGLISYYVFANNVNDVSGNNNNGILHGTISYTQERFGYNSSSLYVKSSNNGYVDLPASINITSSFSVSFWLKTSITRSANYYNACYLIDRNLSTNYYHYYDWSIRYGEGRKIIFNTGNHSSIDTLVSTIDVGDNYWHHICAIYNDSLSIKQLYIDGNLRGQESFSGGIFENNYIPIAVGYPSGFEGAIDDIRLYNRALSSDETNLLYSENGWQLNK